MNSWGDKKNPRPRLRPGIGAKMSSMHIEFKLRVKFTDEILKIYSVVLVVQEFQEGGRIVAISSLPEFKPPPNHQMSLLKTSEFPSEVFSLFEKLQIDFNVAGGEKKSI